MEGILKLVTLFKANIGVISEAVAYLVLFASIVIKMTPTLKDDNYFKPIIKFIGKYIALEKYGPKGE